MHRRLEPYRFASCFSIIVVDWLVFASTMTMHRPWFSAWISATVMGAAATLFTVGVIESRALGAPYHSVYRGLGAALAVAIPLPIAGSLLGLGCLLWAAFAKKGPEQVS